MSNPFQLKWLNGWNFQLVIMDGNVNVEAYGFGIYLRTSLLPGESPKSAADRLIYAENRRRRALRNSWKEGQSSQEVDFARSTHLDKRSLIVIK